MIAIIYLHHFLYHHQTNGPSTEYSCQAKIKTPTSANYSKTNLFLNIIKSDHWNKISKVIVSVKWNFTIIWAIFHNKMACMLPQLQYVQTLEGELSRNCNLLMI